MMTKIHYIADKEPSLHELQALVGGSIELIQLPDGRHMIVNEEGKIEELPLNPEATKIAADTMLALDYGIVGDVVILSGDALLT